MLDENLPGTEVFPKFDIDRDNTNVIPAFFLKPSPDNIKHNRAFFLSYHGSTPEPAYTLKQPDPASPNSKNRYACALFDAYNPDILYGEVLVIPQFTQPSLSQEEIRKNGGVPPPPQPILGKEFTIQLYNPDQQILVTQKPGSWGGSATYEFAMPQNTFRAPSASALDRSQSDPGVAVTTPKVYFTWKRENKFSKDLTCFLTGRSTDVQGKKKNKEPDIAVALFRSLREVTVYEPNLYRVDMEDPKGLEVTILLAATVIKDLYFGNVKEAFNVSETSAGRTNSFGILHRKTSSPPDPNVVVTAPPTSSQALQPPTGGRASPHSLPKLQTTPPPNKHARPPPVQKYPSQRPPVTDARTQWEIDAETQRLKAQEERERRAQAQANEAKRRERERQDEAEARRLQKQLATEDKNRRRKQAEVDKETERLRKVYGTQEDVLGPLPPRQTQRPHSYSIPSGRPQASPKQYPSHTQLLPQDAFLRPAQSSQHLRPQSAQSSRPQPPPRQSNGVYLQPVAGSSSGFFGAPLGTGYQKPKPKRSFFGLRSASDDGGRLMKKQSSIF
ncbi:hypothetical protein EV356DRAFT_572400 [Viridothelium virens]|uniref:Uncharacterized protein n=1 Tax=Viridothelium virens TaxID=1048519 RepID=A0A6A6HNP5_VIRVR|nr:hypothetical protein EV356DRAFT_572400 [Viridothelium virens]